MPDHLHRNHPCTYPTPHLHWPAWLSGPWPVVLTPAQLFVAWEAGH